MKFKVLYLINNTGNEADFSGSFEFYVIQEAIESAQSWASIGGHAAYVWDGDTWRYY